MSMWPFNSTFFKKNSKARNSAIFHCDYGEEVKSDDSDNITDENDNIQDTSSNTNLKRGEEDLQRSSSWNDLDDCRTSIPLCCGLSKISSKKLKLSRLPSKSSEVKNNCLVSRSPELSSCVDINELSRNNTNLNEQFNKSDIHKLLKYEHTDSNDKNSEDFINNNDNNEPVNTESEFDPTKVTLRPKNKPSEISGTVLINMSRDTMFPPGYGRKHHGCDITDNFKDTGDDSNGNEGHKGNRYIKNNAAYNDDTINNNDDDVNDDFELDLNIDNKADIMNNNVKHPETNVFLNKDVNNKLNKIVNNLYSSTSTMTSTTTTFPSTNTPIRIASSKSTLNDKRKLIESKLFNNDNEKQPVKLSQIEGNATKITSSTKLTPSTITPSTMLTKQSTTSATKHYHPPLPVKPVTSPKHSTLDAKSNCFSSSTTLLTSLTTSPSTKIPDFSTLASTSKPPISGKKKISPELKNIFEQNSTIVTPVTNTTVAKKTTPVPKSITTKLTTPTVTATTSMTMNSKVSSTSNFKGCTNYRKSFTTEDADLFHSKPPPLVAPPKLPPKPCLKNKPTNLNNNNINNNNNNHTNDNSDNEEDNNNDNNKKDTDNNNNINNEISSLSVTATQSKSSSLSDLRQDLPPPPSSSTAPSFLHSQIQKGLPPLLSPSSSPQSTSPSQCNTSGLYRELNYKARTQTSTNPTTSTLPSSTKPKTEGNLFLKNCLKLHIPIKDPNNNNDNINADNEDNYSLINEDYDSFDSDEDDDDENKQPNQREEIPPSSSIGTSLVESKGRLISDEFKKSYKVANELYETERMYVKKLHLIDQILHLEIIKRNRVERFLPEEVIPQIFSNVKCIYQFHNDYLLPELTSSLDKWTSAENEEPTIGTTMKKVAPFFKLYTEYVTNFSNANNIIMAWCNKSEKFSSILDELKTLPECGNLSLQHHLLEPIQRIPRYLLLLTEYLKHLPKTSSDCTVCEEALELVTKAAQHTNNEIKKMDKFKKLLDICENLVGGQCENLVSINRELIREGRITKLSARDGSLVERYIFLFNDIMLVCMCLPLKLGFNQQYIVKSKLDVCGMKVYNGYNEDNPNSFVVMSKQKSIEFATSNSEDKDAWLQTIHGVINQYIKKEKTKDREFIEKIYKTEELGKRAPTWVKDQDTSMCMLCSVTFSTFKRRHHCRACGKVVCNECSSHKIRIDYDKEHLNRVCDVCYDLLQDSTTTHHSPGVAKVPQRHKGPSALELKATDRVSKMSGYLYVSMDKKNWSKRWVMLHYDCALYIYKAKKDNAAHNSLPLPGYNVEPVTLDDVTRSNCFRIFHKNLPKVYFFSVDDRSQYDKWMEDIELATRALLPPPPPPSSSSSSSTATPSVKEFLPLPSSSSPLEPPTPSSPSSSSPTIATSVNDTSETPTLE